VADFYAPHSPNMDLLRSAAIGQEMGQQQALAPYRVQGAQQDLEQGQLSIDQLRQVMQKQAMVLDTANQIGALGTQSSSAQSDSAQSAPSNDPLGDVISTRRNALYQKMDLLAGRDPFTSQKAAEASRLEQLGLQLQGPINLAQRLQADPQANIVVAKNTTLKQMWNQWAAARGMNPDDPMNLTVANAQSAARDYEGMLQARLGKPATGGFTGILKPGEAAYQGGNMVAGSPDSMTPYQQQEIKLRRDELAAKGSEQRKPQLVDVPMPDGTTQKQWIIPGHDTGMNVGAPEAAKPGMGMGRVQAAVAKITLAGNEATKSAENLMKLGINTDSGWLGITNPQHGGILTSMKNSLNNQVSREDTKSYAIMVSGVKRNLAAIEAAGNMPPGSLTAQMDQVELKPGDTQINKLQRMAEIRQISEAGLESMLTLPGLTQPQIEQIKSINARMAKAIPFTQDDILNLQQSKNPHMTIADMAKSTGVQGGDTVGPFNDPAKEARYQAWKAAQGK